MNENKYNPELHHRRSIRLKGYDYSLNGLYFVTICVNEKMCLFGEILNEVMILSDAGKMIEEEWNNLSKRFNLILHEYIVMPNHFHAILEIENDDTSAIKYRLGDIVGAFESITTVKYIKKVNNNDWIPFHKKLWQKNYYEHIIRDRESYQSISHYIMTNPQKWKDDLYYL